VLDHNTGYQSTAERAVGVINTGRDPLLKPVGVGAGEGGITLRNDHVKYLELGKECGQRPPHVVDRVGVGLDGEIEYKSLGRDNESCYVTFDSVKIKEMLQPGCHHFPVVVVVIVDNCKLAPPVCSSLYTLTAMERTTA